MLEQVITIKEASDILGITERAVRFKCEQGKLICRKSYGTWLILRSSL